MEGKRLIRFLAGFFLLIVGLFLAAGLFSYVISGEKTSLGGTAGDFLAFYGLSFFGWVSLWFPAVMITFGTALIVRNNDGWLRITAGLCLLFPGLLILLGFPFLAEGVEAREITRLSSGAAGWLLARWLHEKTGMLGMLAGGGFCLSAGAVLLGGKSLLTAVEMSGHALLRGIGAIGHLLAALARTSAGYGRLVVRRIAGFFQRNDAVPAPAGEGGEKRKNRKKAKKDVGVEPKQPAREVVVQGSIPEAPAGPEMAGEEPEPSFVRPAAVSPGSGSGYQLPPLQILHQIRKSDNSGEPEDVIRQRGEILERTLQEFNIEAEVVRVQRGPVVTMYEMALAPGTKVSRVESLDDDLAIALKAPNVRIVAPIPGKSTIGIEVPNASRETVTLRELFMETDKDAAHMDIPLFLGKDTAGAPLLVDLAMAPHLLIAGATGSGKSVCINSIICSIVLTRTPEEVQMLLVDPKSVEFADYQDIPHLICPVVTDMKRAAGVLQWACKKMDDRFSILARTGVRNIGQYNRLGEKEIIKRLDPEEDAQIDDVPFYMPHVVIIIDELGELMLVAAKEVESSVIRLSQKARAVGIHLICATQRPSADVITGLIKANLPVKIAFQVSSKINSRVILDRNGAELLLGRGDMLLIPPGSSRLIRAQGTFVSQAEAADIVDFVSSQREPQFRDELNKVNAEDGDRSQEDELYEEALRIVLETQRGSVSLLQRRLSVGYSRAARLIDMIADAGFIGPYKGSQAREVYMTLDEWENTRAQNA